jgi:(1->4)-alpha-D-glucan 1-alpha-D-glucosylmutase
MLAELDSHDGCDRQLRSLITNWRDGAVKLFITSRILRLRRQYPELFAQGEYEPLMADGAKADCICGFARIHEGRAAVTVAARFPARRSQEPGWGGSTLALPGKLAGATLRNIFTGRELSASDFEQAVELVFDGAPVAVFLAG